MKAIVAGGRDFKSSAEHYEWLYKLCEQLSVDEIVSGGCSGADRFGEWFAADYDMKLTRFPADWKTHGRSAGPIRNKKMAEYADICILFPGGAGTKSMLECAKQCNLHIEQWNAT